MSDKCGCDYLNIDEKIFKRYPPKIAVTKALEVLWPLFHQKCAFKKVVRIAAHVPEDEEMNRILKENEKTLGSKYDRDITAIVNTNTNKLDLTIQAIEGSFANVIVDSPFTENEDTIKFLSRYAKQHKDGIVFWRNKLLDHLRNYPEESPLDETKNWNKYLDQMKILIREFNLPADAFQAIWLSKTEKFGYTFPIECINALNSMRIPVNYKAYLDVADFYMKRANGQCRDRDRRDDTEKACDLYELISKHFTIEQRQKILDVWKNEKDRHNASKETIKTASAIIPFKYKTHGFWYS